MLARYILCRFQNDSQKVYRYSDERIDLMLQVYDIYSKLEQNMDSNPENNYDLFCSKEV